MALTYEVRKAGPWHVWWVLGNAPGQPTHILASGKNPTEDQAHRRARAALTCARIKEELIMEETPKFIAVEEIPWRYFKSAHKSHVLRGYYDADKCHLYIQFRDKHDAPGDIYVYEDVDLETWKGLCEAESKGSFLNRTIVPLFPCVTKLGKATEAA